MAENEDRDVNVTEPAAPGGEGAGGDGATDGGQSASEGLHIHGQGHEALEDGVEQQGTPDNLRPSEDVFGNANVQSGRRSTNEGLLNGLPAQGETVADQSPVIADDYVPSEPDNAVESEFDAQPEGRQRTVAADGADEADEDVVAEDEPAELRRTELPPGEPQGAPAADPAPPAAPQAAAFAPPLAEDIVLPPAAADETPADPEIGETDPVEDLFPTDETPTATDPTPTPTPTPDPEPTPTPDPEPTPPTDGPSEPPPPPTPPEEEEEEEEEPDTRTAQDPKVVAVAANGIEDLAIKLDITASSTDNDGGAETLSVVIRDVPGGFSFADGAGDAVGTELEPGVWSVPVDALDDLYFVRPQHYSGDVTLTIEVTAREVTGHTATTTTTLPVHVEAVADAPTLQATNAAGTENEWIDLDVQAALVDADTSETLTIYITGMPDGAVLNHGTQLAADLDLPGGVTLPAGTWVLSSTDLGDLQVKSAADSSRDFTLNVYGVTEEDMNGDRAVTGPATIEVDVGVVKPTVTASGSGLEDQWADVTIDAQIQADAAGDGEALTLYVENLPPDAVLRDKTTGTIITAGPDGRYDVTASATSLQVRWAEGSTHEHSDEDITFTIRAVVTDDDVGTDRDTPRDTNDQTTTVTVDVKAVADDVVVQAQNSGIEDQTGGIAVTPTITLIDKDGTESLTGDVVLVTTDAQMAEGVLKLNGAAVPVVHDAAAGTWSYTLAASAFTFDAATKSYSISGLTYEPETHSDVDISYSVTATVTDNDGSVNTKTYDGASITVRAIADAPDLAVTQAGGTEHTGGAADGWISLPVADLALVDQDTTESLTLYIGGLPDGAELRLDGQPVSMVAAPTLGGTGAAGLAAPGLTGSVAMIPQDMIAKVLAGELEVRLPAGRSEDFSLRFVAVTEEANGVADHGTAEQSWTVADMRVDVGVLAPVASAGTMTGTEGQWAALDSLAVEVKAPTAGLTQETLTITLSGADLDPTKSELRDNTGKILTPGTDGSYDVSAYYNATSGKVEGLSARWKDSFSSDSLDFTLTAKVVDGDAGTDTFDAAGTPYADEASHSTTVSVSFAPVVNDATIAANDSGKEDADTPSVAGDGIALSPRITLSADGSEAVSGPLVFTFDATNAGRGTLRWVPADGTGAVDDVLTAGTVGTDGTVTYQLASSVLVPGAGGGLVIDPSMGRLELVPTEHSDEDVTYGISVTVSDGTAQKTFDGTGTVTIEAVADKVEIVSSGTGMEDEFAGAITVPLTIALVDKDGSESLTGTIDIVLDAEAAKAGTLAFAGDPSKFSVETEADGGLVYRITVADNPNVSYDAASKSYTVSGLTLDPATNSDADVAYSVRATTIEADGGDTRTTTFDGGLITVKAVADRPDLEAGDVGGTESATGDNWITVDVTKLALTDTDTSESLTLYIGGVPAGGALRFDMASGAPALETVAAADLGWSGVDKPDTVPALTGTVYKITVAADADIDAILSSLQVRPAAGSSKDFSLQLVAVSEEQRGEADHDGVPERNWSTAEVRVDVGVLAPTVDVSATQGASGLEESWTPVDGIKIALAAPTGGEETLTVTLTGDDIGGMLFQKGDGSALTVQTAADGSKYVDVTGLYDEASSEIKGLQVRWSDDDRSDAIDFTVRAHVVDQDAVGSPTHTPLGQQWADEAVAEQSVSIDIKPVADAATVTASGVGVESDDADAWVKLDLTWKASDSSEVVSGVTLSGLPTGAVVRFPEAAGSSTFTGVTADATGAVALPTFTDAADQSRIYIEWPADASTWNGGSNTTQLTLSVTTREPGATNPEAETTHDTTFDVRVYGDADTPEGATDETAHQLAEGAFHTIQWSADTTLSAGEDLYGRVTDTDGSESLTFRITPDDAGARLIIDGRPDQPPGGPWIVSAADLESGKVHIGGPEHWGSSETDPEIRFKVTAIATEADAGEWDNSLTGITNPETGVPLARQGTAEKDIGDLVIKATAAADSVSLIEGTAGDTVLEDQSVTVAPSFTLIDTDGSESLFDALYVETADRDMLLGTLTLNGTALEAYEITGRAADGRPIVATTAVAAADVDAGLDAGKTYAYVLPLSAAVATTANTFEVQGLVFAPRAQSDDDVDYKLLVTTEEASNGDTKVTSIDGTITVTAVADAPTVANATNQAVMEQAGTVDVPLDFDLSAVDLDTSETLTVYLTTSHAGAGTLLWNGTAVDPLAQSTTMPNGSVLPGARTYALVIPQDQLDSLDTVLDNLVLRLPAGDSRDVLVDINAVTREDDPNGQPREAMALASQQVRIDVGTEEPTLTVVGNGSFTLTEGTSFSNGWQQINLLQDLQVAEAFPNAADGGKLYLHLFDLPSDLKLRVKVGNTWQDINKTTVPDENGGTKEVYRFEAQYADEVRFQWKSGALNDDTNFQIKAQAVYQDKDYGTALSSGVGTAAPDIAFSAVQTLDVVVVARPDEATLSGSGVGLEEEWSPLTLSVAVKDASEEVTGLTLAGFPSGTQLRLDGVVITANPDGTFTLPTGDLVALNSKLEFKTPADFSTYDGQLNLTLKATTAEKDLGDGREIASTNEKETTTTVKVTVYGDADAPTIDVVDATQTLAEDGSYKLSDGLTVDYGEPDGTDLDKSADGSESRWYEIKLTADSPAGKGRLFLDNDGDGKLGAGDTVVEQTGGVWRVDASDMAKLHVGAVDNWSGDLGFDVTVFVREHDADAAATGLPDDLLPKWQGQAEATDTLSLTITPDADSVTFGSTGGGWEDGVEGHPIVVTPTITMVDADGSEQVTSIYFVSSDPTLLADSVRLDGAVLQRLTVTAVDADGRPVAFSSDPAAVAVTDGGRPLYAWDIAGAFDGTIGTSQSAYTASGLTIQPKAHSSQEVEYRLLATVEDHGAGGSTSTRLAYSPSALSIRVDAVADAPTLGLSGSTVSVVDGKTLVTGTEDTYIALGIGTDLVDKDGSEVLSVRLDDVPDGWRIGFMNGSTFQEVKRQDDGSFDLGGDPARIATAVILPPKNLHTEVSPTDPTYTQAPTIRITSTSRETESSDKVAVETASVSETVTIVVNPTADKPFLVVRNVVMNEDAEPMSIDVLSAITDDVNPEQLTVLVKADLPAGTKLFGTDGQELTATVTRDGATWYDVTAHVGSLKVQPAADSNVDFALSVRAISTEIDGSEADRTGALKVTVIGTADDPTWNGDALAPGATVTVATVDEDRTDNDGWFSLNLGKLGTEDTDGSETITLVLRDIPDGMQVAMAAGFEKYMKFVGTVDGAPRWAIEGQYLDKVQAKITDANFSGQKAVGVDLIVTEDDGATKTTQHMLAVDVEAVSDHANIGIVARSGGDEDSFGATGVPVTLSLTPQDLVFEAESITGVTVNFDALGLTNLTLRVAAVDDSNDVLEVQIGDGVELTLSGQDLAKYFDAATGKLGEMSISGLPDHWSTDIPVTITASSGHAGSPAQTTTVNTSVVIDAVVDEAKTFAASNVTGTAAATWHALPIALDLTDTDGSEKRYLIIDGVPATAKLNHGYFAGEGRWIVALDDKAGVDTLADLKIAGAAGTSGTLSVTAMIRDVDPDDKDVTVWTSTQPVFVAFAIDNGGTGGGNAGDPTDTTVDTFFELLQQNGLEDQSIVLRGSREHVVSGETVRSDVTAIVITGLVGATLVAKTPGAFAFYEPTEGTYVIPVESLENGEITLQQTRADSDQPVTFQMKVVAQGDGFTTQETAAAPVQILVDPETDGVTISAAVTTVAEDTASVPLDLTITPNEQANFSETFAEADPVLVIKMTNVPAGATLSLNGQTLTAESDGSFKVRVADLQDAGESPVADLAAALEAGHPITLTGLAVDNLPENWHGTVSLEVAVDIADNGQDVETSLGTISFTVTPQTETGTFDVPNDPTPAIEDNPFAVTARLDMDDRIGSGEAHASELVSVVIRGVPAGAVLSGASNNGSYTVDGVTYTEWVVKADNIAADGTIQDVSLRPPLDWTGDIKLELVAYTMEEDVKVPVEAARSTVTVEVSGVADVATIDPQDVTDAREETPVKLVFDAELSDQTGETLYVVVKGVPEGASLVNGDGTAFIEVKVDADGNAVFDVATGTPVAAEAGEATGVWVVTNPEDAYFKGAENESGTVEMSARVVTVEDGTIAQSDDIPFTVEVLGVADAPNLSIAQDTVTGAEDQARNPDGSADGTAGIPLGITASLSDLTGESLQLVITGAPAGSLFFGAGTAPYEAQTVAGVPTWTIQGDDIADLRLVTPPDYNGTATLQVTAVSLEDGTEASSVTIPLTVEVAAVNDAPVISTDTFYKSLEGGDEPVLVLPNPENGTADVVISDADLNDVIKKMMIAISKGAQTGDTLGLTDQTVLFNPLNGRLEVSVEGHASPIALSYDAATHTMTFSGEASHEVYVSLAKSVILTSGDGELIGSEEERTFTITVEDKEGATSSVETQVLIENDITLEDDARGNLFFITGDTATITGTDGDDLFVYGVAGADYNEDVVINGMGNTPDGADTLVMMDAGGVDANWLFQIDSDAPSAEDPADGTGGLVYDVTVEEGNATVSDGGHTVDLEPADGGTEVAATITFDDHKTVETHDVEQILT